MSAGQTRIDFYFDAEDKLEVAIRIVQKAYTSGQRVLILAADPAQYDTLDRRLWTQQTHSFLPHCGIDDALAPETPILLAAASTHPSALPFSDLLINLTAFLPNNFTQFKRLIEIVSTHEADKAPARERFRHYRAAGYDIQSHRLGERT